MGTLSVPLTQGKIAIIDEEDHSLIAPYQWYARRAYNTWYAEASPRLGYRGAPPIAMHRLITEAKPGEMVDHRDGDGLNNRRRNIRRCTNSQNQQNRRHLTTNTSGFRGVTFHRRLGKWQAAIKHDGISYYLGVFDDAEQAARAYDRKARELFGEFAVPNFPDEGAAA